MKRIYPQPLLPNNEVDYMDLLAAKCYKYDIIAQFSYLQLSQLSSLSTAFYLFHIKEPYDTKILRL